MERTKKLWNASDLRFAYFGSQTRYAGEIIPRIIPWLPKGGIYADGTSGSCGTPFKMKKQGYTVYTNDRGFLSFCIGKAFVERNEHYTEQDIEEILDYTPQEGFVFNAWQKLPFDPEVAKHIDGYLLHNKNNHFALVCCGSFIMAHLTFRSIGWDKKLVANLTVDVLRERIAFTLRRLARVPIPGNAKAFWGDARDFVTQQSGDLVYFDPAWPWTDGRKAEIYEFSDEVSDILQQKKTENKFWSGDEALIGSIEFVKKSIPNWKHVALSTQSTNYPPHERVEEELRKLFPKLYVDTYKVISRASNNEFIEYLYIV